jgi:ribonucleoside-triphosphate reductase
MAVSKIMEYEHKVAPAEIDGLGHVNNQVYLDWFMTAAAKHAASAGWNLERLLALGDSGPLALLTMNRDGAPYLRMHRVTNLIGMVGLNEMVQIHKGQQLHEADEALRFGLKTIAYMKLLCDKMSQKHNMRFVLEQTPAESTAYRFAKLDLREFSPRSGHVVKGDISRGEIYYSNSTYLNVGNVMNPIDRAYKEGLFHPLIEAGALTHIWMGEARPSKESLANFVMKVFRNTENE